jgi:hypothetical protein
MNKRVFPNLYFDPEVDVPNNLSIASRADSNWPGQIDFNQVSDPYYVNPGDQNPTAAFTINTPDENSTGLVFNILGPRTHKATEPFSTATMWKSSTIPSGGTASITLHSTTLTLLNGLVVHTGADNDLNSADQVCLIDSNTNTQVGCASYVGVDDIISFPPHVSSNWEVRFRPKAGSSNVVVRGLQFLTPEGEIFPHKMPVELLTRPLITTQPAVSTCTSNEWGGSKVFHVVNPVIAPNYYAPNGSGFDPSTMWHSCNTNSVGWTTITVQFPQPITLDKIDIHSQHSGLYHAANQIQVAWVNANGQDVFLGRKNVAVDDYISFTAAKSTTWRLSFHSTDGYVTIRGLRFHSAWSHLSGSGYSDMPDGVYQ